MSSNLKIVNRNISFADWYTSVIHSAKLMQYTDVKGFMIFEPNGWALWENIKAILDNQFKKLGIKNLYMPLLIPMSEFHKEKEHIEGFAPELYTVTHIGNKKLDDELAIRPTSEIWFCKYFKNVVQSYKDLPLKTNQWTSVLRAEKNTKPFLRNTEFHWHEVHAIFQTFEESDNFSKMFLDLYGNFCEKELCIPVIKGRKTENEKFAGADITYTIESMMQDGQALQSATSHTLGQNFAKSYDIKFQNKDNKLEYVWQTSHGLTTRIIGAIIMVHGDDKGIVLPFNIAPIQIQVIALMGHKNPQVVEYANKIKDQLSYLYKVDVINNDKSIGYLLSESEVNGIPINIIVGEKDLENQTFTYNTRINSEKQQINIDALLSTINFVKQEYNQMLYNKAKTHLDSNIVEVNNFEDFKTSIENSKWVKAYFSADVKDEQKIKELTGATARCIIKEVEQEQTCFFSGKKTNKLVIFAKAY